MMDTRFDLHDEPLTREEEQALRNKRTGLALFQFSWIMVFVSLIVANLQLRNQSASWPPPGVQELGAAVPTVMLVALVMSSFFARRGLSALKGYQSRAALLQWRFALLLGVLFVIIMGIEWVRTPVTGQYSMVFRVMVAFHGIHALVIGVFMTFIERGMNSGFYNPRHFWPVEAAAKLWYFVTAAWFLFYLVIYWI